MLVKNIDLTLLSQGSYTCKCQVQILNWCQKIHLLFVVYAWELHWC